ncbi:MAG: bifunctional 4-hydroxy-2-oxoglutarate aldolase/2-dehydro-3-deoxy-phosphogluconate aldolase [Vampirovibrionales bacterium]|nr:bifunctional 4-hydroxy-2-oxoglutarate aldolase/2-dehydro-3-deoxy-phosphogluconate aldolase [Vampirovibrionales bacterium]
MLELPGLLEMRETAAARHAALLEALRQEQAIAVIRAYTPDGAQWAAEILLECGVNAIEITCTVPDAALVTQNLAAQYPQALFGAGTLLSIDQAQAMREAGARFFVSPVLDEALIRWAHEAGVAYFPAAFTPTEIMRAFSLGAPAVKVFPAAQAGGAAFLKALHEPLGELPLIPTGGVTLEDFTEYLDQGALTVGLGGCLAPVQAIGERNEGELRKRAQTLIRRRDRYRQQLALPKR